MELIRKLKLYFKKFYSINKIDQKMLKYINYENGYYIECGANDGIRQSNTFHFEKSKGWKGVLIEPSYKFEKLIRNRSKKNFFSNNCCVSLANENQMIKFKYLNLMTKIIDKKIMKSDHDSEEKNNIEKKFMTSDEKIFDFESKGRTLTSILDEANSPNLIDFFSLDVEGAEFEVIDGIDFDKYNFKFFLIETDNFTKLNKILKNKKYFFLENLTNHDYLFTYKK